MKKKLILILAVVLIAVCAFVGVTACADDTIVVYTNAYFAPFEYFADADTIAGVDIDIMNMVGEKLGRDVKFENVDFDVIIPNVHSGSLCDVGAAGITITEEREAQVDFSTPYYTSVQYVVYTDNSGITTSTVDGQEVIFWSQLAGKQVGVQRETTGQIYVDGEISGDGFDGVLKDTGAKCNPFDDVTVAITAMTSGSETADVVVIDQLPALYYVDANSAVKCAPLYYDGTADSDPVATEEEYAICVTPGQTELLEAINAVLNDLINDVDENGDNGIDRLVAKHFGLDA